MKQFDVVRVVRLRDDRMDQSQIFYQRRPLVGDIGTILEESHLLTLRSKSSAPTRRMASPFGSKRCIRMSSSWSSHIAEDDSMSAKDLNSRIPAYKKAFASGEIQKTYQGLVAIVQDLRTDFSKKYADKYAIASVLHGYIDVTYFYLQNEYLKKRKLKFAIVLNHKHAHFELWLLGQTKKVQIDTWKKLKGSKWVKGEAMPKYSVFEIVLLPAPDFDDFKKLSKSLHSMLGSVSREIFSTLKVYE